MNFDLSEAQKLFRAAAERWAEPVDVEARRKVRLAKGGYDRARWSKLADLGFFALGAAENQGGLGGSLLDLAVIAEAFGRGNAVDPWLENAVLPIRLLSAAAAAAETGAGAGTSSSAGVALLQSYLDGSKIAAFAFAESGDGYDITPRKTRVERVENGDYILSGEKSFVIGGALADTFIVSADMGGEMIFLLLPAASEGVQRRTYRIVDGSQAALVVFRNVVLPADSRLALDVSGLRTVISEIRILSGAEMVGLGQRLLDDTLSYVKRREQFGVTIGSFQAIQHQLVDCYAALEQMRSMNLRMILAGREDTRVWQANAAGAKAFIAEQASSIAKSAVQYHGGIGIADELPLGHAVKRLLLLSRLFGDASTNLHKYAKVA